MDLNIILYYYHNVIQLVWLHIEMSATAGRTHGVHIMNPTNYDDGLTLCTSVC